MPDTMPNSPFVEHRDLTYAGGFAGLMRNHGPEAASAMPYEGMEELLRDLSAPGIATLKDQKLPKHGKKTWPDPILTAQDKYEEICSKFRDAPALLALHGMTIAASRRQGVPDIARDLFVKMWRAEWSFLLDHLPARWQISALQTFRSFGETELERRLAGEMSVLFAMSKLYESERLYSGKAPDKHFFFGKRAREPLPYGMTDLPLQLGDQDRNLLAQLWYDAENPTTLGPLARHLLHAINADQGGVFRRLNIMRDIQRRRQAKKR